ncbi:YncE family protein [Pseudomonas marginalis]|jgi:hypothetical protein|uniref:YncE family protein n=1 Tax=Pseudomonas marginalis TaxID=298 RepID=UPI00127E757F|nr:YncE family protein [Pseudomonas marginalis]KAA8555454.1 Hydrazine synthase subunit beta [Pseudomonas marginalis]
MSGSSTKPLPLLAINLPGQRRRPGNAVDKQAAQHGFYPNKGLDVHVRETFGQADSAVELILDGEVIASHKLEGDPLQAGIKFSVAAERLTHGRHVLSYQVKQGRSGLRQATRQAIVRVHAQRLLYLGVPVKKNDERVYVNIDIRVEPCIATLTAAAEVVHMIESNIGSFLFSPDGRYLHAEWVNGIAKIDLQTISLVDNYPVFIEKLGGFSPDGRFLYACNWLYSHLFIVDVQEKELLPGAVIEEYATGLVLGRDGGQIYVGAWGGPGNAEASLIIVDRASQEVIKKIPVGAITFDTVGNPHDGHVYVACLGVLGEGAGVYRFDPVSERVEKISKHPAWGLTLSANGQRLYAYGGDIISVIDTKTGREKENQRLSVRSLAVSPDGKWVYTGSYEEHGRIDVYDAQGWTLDHSISIFKPFIHRMETQKSNGDLWVCFSSE